MSPHNEPQYLNLRLRRPSSVWPLARLISVGATLALIVLLAVRPTTGLDVFWQLLTPLLPLVFMVAPGLWRNVCPMAAVNQMPRVLGITRARRLPDWLERHGYAIGLLLFFALITGRKTGLEDEAQALALILVGGLALPLLGGLLYRGKSGFCGSICPLRGVQGLYGQTPFARVENSHCKPCVGCQSNCPDLKPDTALRDDLHDEEAQRGRYVRLFAGAFPGFVIAFYTVPDVAGAGLAAMYLRIGLFMLASLGSFFLLESLTRAGAERVVALYAATGFSAFYWFNVPIFAEAVSRHFANGGQVPDWAVWEARVAMIGLSLAWVVRTFRKARGLSAESASRVELPLAPPGSTVAPRAEPRPAAAPTPARPAPARPAPARPPARPAVVKVDPAAPKAKKPPASRPVTEHGQPMAGDPPVPVPDRRSRARPMRRPEVVLLPEGRRLETPAGTSLLEVAQGNGLEVESGCQMGICGCDPVYVCDGMENLSPVEEGERATIQRLGLPDHTRMACVARVHGDVVISLDPAVGIGEHEDREEPAAAAAAAANGHRNGTGPAERVVAAVRRAPKPIQSSVRRVVIVGNGIAGVTAADHIRRHHADCHIDLVTDERHPFYNRTSVSRLIHERAGMHRMYLLPDTWYDERRITSWLNTAATKIDTKNRRVLLGTGEALGYDRLIMATGSSAYIPQMNGFGLEGSFSLRKADDAMLIRQYAQQSHCRRAMVLGGGVLGLEAAEALAELGIEVTVIERAYWLAPTQLDARAGRFLYEHLRNLGIEVVLGANVSSVLGNGHVSGVQLEDGSKRDADLVVVCAGISPNVDLARDAGLKVNRGVVVDDGMRTSDPSVYAAGDVAEHAGRLYGLWPAAVEQAEVAAINAIGSGAIYAGSIVPTHLKLSTVELTTIGEPHGESGDTEVVLEDRARGRYRKLIVSGGKIVGAILLGQPGDAPTVLTAIREGRDVSGDLDALSAGDWSVLSESYFEQAVAAPMARHRSSGDSAAAAG